MLPLLIQTLLAIVIVVQPAPVHAEVAAPIVFEAPESVQEKIVFYANKWHADENKIARTVQCESHGSTTIQSFVPDPSGPNGREDSWGVAQIFLPKHADVTKAQALDPDFALNWMAQQFALDNAHLWTCYRLLYGS